MASAATVAIQCHMVSESSFEIGAASHQLPARCLRDGTRARYREQGRSRLSSRQPDAEAARDDGAMGRMVR